MLKSQFSKTLLLSVTLYFLGISLLIAQKISVTTSPSSARIYVNGVLKGTGNVMVAVGRNDCVTVQVREEGYITEMRTYCRKRGVNPPPDADMIELKTDEALSSSVIMVTTQPQTAKIMVNGVVMGAGSLQVTVPFGECVSVEIQEEGFITEVRDYCKKKGMTPPPKSDYFKLQADESYTSSIQNVDANHEIPMSVKKERTREEAWKIIVSTILDKFDVLEANDEKLGYLRTSWVGANFKANTVRMRVIVKQNSEDPLQYKIKFVSEFSGRSGTAFTADEQFQPFGRILKKYDGFLDEIVTKLKN